MREAALHHVSQLHHTAVHVELSARPSWAPQPPWPPLLLRPHPGQGSCTPRDGCQPPEDWSPFREMLTNSEHYNPAVLQSLYLTPAQAPSEKQPRASSILMALPLKHQSHRCLKQNYSELPPAQLHPARPRRLFLNLLLDCAASSSVPPRRAPSLPTRETRTLF